MVGLDEGGSWVGVVDDAAVAVVILDWFYSSKLVI